MADALAIITDDKSGYLRPNGHNRRGFGSSVSTNMLHTKVAREKPPAPAPVEAPPIAAPTIARPPSPIGRLIATYDDVVDVFRARADELELSRLEIDHLSGLASGHSSHLLAKKHTQRLGAISLPLMLDTLGLRLLVVEDRRLTALMRWIAVEDPPSPAAVVRLLVVEDPDRTVRTLKRRTPRKSSHLRVMRKLSAPST